MITLQDLSAELQALFSGYEFTDYCPNGLQVEGKGKVARIAFAVSASLAVIQECVHRKVDGLIVHHGIFWNKDSYILTGPKREKLRLLLSHDISLFGYHLPLDAHQIIGNNWKAALDLGMTDLHPFCPQGKGYIGVKGLFSRKAISAFQKELEAYYGHPAHVALGGKENVSSAAIVSGGAHRSIEQAIQEGVDCFITGSFDEPIWDIAHEQKINFLALGHYATERIGVMALMDLLQKKLPISCEWIDFPNPF